MSPIIKKTLTSFLLFFAPLLISETKDISIVVHGGAGWFSSMTEDEIEGIESALNNAADLGYKVMLEGGTSLDAVEQAIIILENNPLFNAGKGSVYTSELKQEMDASIMDGSNLDAGAVASITSVKNPITLARYVMENTEHVMFSSTGAEKVAKETSLGEGGKPKSYEQFLKALKKGGVKQEELEWTGFIEEFKGRKDLTRNEVTKFFRDNRLDVEEEIYDDQDVNAFSRFTYANKFDDSSIDISPEMERLEDMYAILNDDVNDFRTTVDNLDETYNRLVEAGVYFNSPPQLSPDGFAKVTFCKDPDGSLIELVEELR